MDLLTYLLTYLHVDAGGPDGTPGPRPPTPLLTGEGGR